MLRVMIVNGAVNLRKDLLLLTLYSNNICYWDLSEIQHPLLLQYFLFIYFLGLSLQKTSKALELSKDQKRSYVAIWDWIQLFGSFHIYSQHRRDSAFIIDQTIFQIGVQHFSLWICIEPIQKSVLWKPHFRGEKHVCSRKFISSLISRYGKYTLYTNGETWYP